MTGEQWEAREVQERIEALEARVKKLEKVPVKKGKR